jgi:hypothetical protein
VPLRAAVSVNAAAARQFDLASCRSTSVTLHTKRWSVAAQLKAVRPIRLDVSVTPCHKCDTRLERPQFQERPSFVGVPLFLQTDKPRSPGQKTGSQRLDGTPAETFLSYRPSKSPVYGPAGFIGPKSWPTVNGAAARQSANEPLRLEHLTARSQAGDGLQKAEQLPCSQAGFRPRKFLILQKELP